ncbi:MAG TPA: hypothetical protein VFI30_02915 [Nocardioidaceae bacterium]|nr:hypothetical protein [Nocardioidaceae bacterium]
MTHELRKVGSLWHGEPLERSRLVAVLYDQWERDIPPPRSLLPSAQYLLKGLRAIISDLRRHSIPRALEPPSGLKLLTFTMAREAWEFERVELLEPPAAQLLTECLKWPTDSENYPLSRDIRLWVKSTSGSRLELYVGQFYFGSVEVPDAVIGVAEALRRKKIALDGRFSLEEAADGSLTVEEVLVGLPRN